MNHKNVPKRSKQGGFTLLQTVIVVVIVSILAGLAVVSFTPTIQRTRLAEDAGFLSLDLKHARSEAIKRRRAVSACKTTDGIRCDHTAGDWNQGWLVFTDINGDGVLDTAPDACQPTPTSQHDCLLRVRRAIDDNNDLRSTSNITRITFNPDGTVANLGNRGQFNLCTNINVGDAAEKAVFIELSGHVAVENQFTCP